MSPIASYRRLFALAGPLYVVTAFLGRLRASLPTLRAHNEQSIAMVREVGDSRYHGNFLVTLSNQHL